MPESSYTDCRCRDCFEIAISNDRASPDFCWECEENGCTDDHECQIVERYSDNYGEDWAL